LRQGLSMERVEPFQRSHGSSWDNDNRSDNDDNQPCEDSIPDTPKPGPASSKLRFNPSLMSNFILGSKMIRGDPSQTSSSRLVLLRCRRQKILRNDVHRSQLMQTGSFTSSISKRSSIQTGARIRRLDISATIEHGPRIHFSVESGFLDLPHSPTLLMVLRGVWGSSFVVQKAVSRLYIP
jgi:hypothetical protein